MPELSDQAYNTTWNNKRLVVPSLRGSMNRETPYPLKKAGVNNVESNPWCLVCQMPHSSFQCSVAFKIFQ